MEFIHGKADAQLLAQRGVGGVGRLGQAAAARSLSQDFVSVDHPYFLGAFHPGGGWEVKAEFAQSAEPGVGWR